MCVLELASPEKDKGVIGVFALNGTGEKEVHIRAKGVDASKNYTVTLDNDNCSFEISGRELKMNGINIYLPASLSSELVMYKEV